MNTQPTVAVVVPTYNPGLLWQEWIDAYLAQTYPVQQTLIIDSGSSDNTLELTSPHGFLIHKIPNSEFNHGGTRQLALRLIQPVDVVVFLTQDAIFSDSESLTRLVSCFRHEKTGAAYGRQLPHKNATIIAAHARYFNYPAQSLVKNMALVNTIGFKTVFISNSYAAYRRQALLDCGGFPENVIFGEDTCTAAKLMLKGWDLEYCASASVFHSHNYSLSEEFRRYFDIGVLHSREYWLLEKFGVPGGEGKRYVRSELGYLLAGNIWQIPAALLRTLAKYVAYRAGRMEALLPRAIKSVLSWNRKYWRQS